MDEKGFMIGVMNKQRRIFSKDAFEKGRIIGATHDGNREWITVLATICADGTWIPPALIYASQSGDIQDTWVNESASLDYQAHVASSPNGWTDDITALHWLEEIFDRYTKEKASNGLRKRLLYLNGYSSHLNMNFINWCNKHNILLAIYPPHSTHRLQPLDVSLFSPLSTAYTRQLEQLIQRSQNTTRVTKRDFLALFWTAFTSSFS
jgi:hypothetical protein